MAVENTKGDIVPDSGSGHDIEMAPSQDTAHDPALANAKKWGLQPPEILRNISAEERAKLETSLRRKIDLRLLPMIIIMYILNYLDR